MDKNLLEKKIERMIKKMEVTSEIAKLELPELWKLSFAIGGLSGPLHDLAEMLAYYAFQKELSWMITEHNSEFKSVESGIQDTFRNITKCIFSMTEIDFKLLSDSMEDLKKDREDKEKLIRTY